MVQTVETIRVYLNENRQGVVTCVHCGVKYPVNMSNYTDHHLGAKASKVKCSSCKKIFHIKFDFRRYHRIDVNIPGKISHIHTREKNIDINIVSLSVGGVGFVVNEVFSWKKEDVFEIKFQLDDDDSAVICEEISIKYSNGQFVGAEFYHSDRYNYELDFYIMSKTLDA
jgi:predicted Zn finger-like uncharacterized protein